VILADAIMYKEGPESLTGRSDSDPTADRPSRPSRAVPRAALVEEALIAQVPIERSHIDCPSAECDGS
jgi:hypothetical protein